MISYERFWTTLKNSKETTYTLINNRGVSSGLLDRIRKGKAITTTTIDDLCKILDCGVEDILEYVKEEN